MPAAGSPGAESLQTPAAVWTYGARSRAQVVAKRSWIENLYADGLRPPPGTLSPPAAVSVSASRFSWTLSMLSGHLGGVSTTGGWAGSLLAQRLRGHSVLTPHQARHRNSRVLGSCWRMSRTASSSSRVVTCPVSCTACEMQPVSFRANGVAIVEIAHNVEYLPLLATDGRGNRRHEFPVRLLHEG